MTLEKWLVIIQNTGVMTTFLQGHGDSSSVRFPSKPTGENRKNPPTPVERVDDSPQLGLPSESLIKAEGFWDCYFLGMLR